MRARRIRGGTPLELSFNAVLTGVPWKAAACLGNLKDLRVRRGASLTAEKVMARDQLVERPNTLLEARLLVAKRKLAGSAGIA